MSKQTEALKLALEALKELRMLGMNAQWHDSWLAKPNEAITAIREALAEQPAQQQAGDSKTGESETQSDLKFAGETQAQQQESVAEYIGECNDGSLVQLYDDVKKGAKFYTSPQPSKPWVGLTDEEIDKCYYYKSRQWTTDELVRHVEAMLREKNA